MEYRYADIGALASALRAGHVSARELSDEALRLLADIGGVHHAVAEVLPDRAHREATAAERRLRSGDDSLLCGIPYGVKDVFAARGGHTTWGSPSFAAQVIDRDAAVVGRLRRAGSVLVAKLAMAELAGGGRAARPGASLHGQARNPWNAAHYSGGSSGGSAVAVAIGTVPFAIGTETGGSILGPAAFSGVTGLRPTFGVVPRAGSMTLSWTLDKVGPLARSAEACAVVMDAIARPRNQGTFARYVDNSAELASLRVGFDPNETDEVSPSIQLALSRAIDDFRRVCPNLVELHLERNVRFVTALEDIVRIEAGFAFREHLERPGFGMSDERQLATLRSARDDRAFRYLEAREVMVAAKRTFRRVFSGLDLVLSATRPTSAPPLSEYQGPPEAGTLADVLRAAGNLAGVPAISVPCGLSQEGLPVGLQLVGPPHSDALLLGVAAAYQRTTEHHLVRPLDRAP